MSWRSVFWIPGALLTLALLAIETRAWRDNRYLKWCHSS